MWLGHHFILSVRASLVITHTMVIKCNNNNNNTNSSTICEVRRKLWSRVERAQKATTQYSHIAEWIHMRRNQRSRVLYDQWMINTGTCYTIAIQIQSCFHIGVHRWKDAAHTQIVFFYSLALPFSNIPFPQIFCSALSRASHFRHTDIGDFDKLKHVDLERQIGKQNCFEI